MKFPSYSILKFCGYGPVKSGEDTVGWVHRINLPRQRPCARYEFRHGAQIEAVADSYDDLRKKVLSL